MAIEYFQINENDSEVLDQLVALEQSARGDKGGLSHFDLYAFIRYGRLYAAVEYDEVLGYAYYFKDFENPGRVYLGGITIKPSESGKGLGESLLLSTFADLKDSNLRMVEVIVHRENHRAHRVYTEKLGFHAINISEDSLYEDEEEYIILRKVLS